MKTKLMFVPVLAAVISAISLSGCKKDDDKDDDKTENTDTGSGTGTGSNTATGTGSNTDTTETKSAFKVQLKNSAAALTSVAASITAKLGGVDLLEECTGDQPPGDCLKQGKAPDPDIWVNAGCDNDIAKCTTSNTEFFELIDPTAANTVLNSQGRSIDAGVFTKVRIYFLNNDGGDALECDGAATAIKPQVPITVTLPSKITVAAGDNVTVTLIYDPSAVDCADGATITNMFASMTATATKN